MLKATCNLLAIGMVLGLMSTESLKSVFGRNGDSLPGPPNIVIFFVDDMGYGDLGSYGHPTIRTPMIDQLAREGIRFTSFYVGAPSCSPSRAALLTGKYPQKVGVPQVLGPDSRGGLDPHSPTLAELLRDGGYRTKAVGKWHLGHAEDSMRPLARGFDEYFGLLYSNDMIPPWVETNRPLELWRNDRPIESPVDQDTLTVRYTEEALEFLRAETDRPFFLYLAYSMVHVPIHASERFRGKSRAGLYGDVVEAIDWSVGEVDRTLRDLGLANDTLVFFSSDNGPWLNMPDRMFRGSEIEPWDAGSPGPLRGWKGTTWEGGQRVPAIIRWPGKIEPGQTSAEMVTAMDVLPTILAACGISSDTLELDGLDLLPFLTKGVPPPRDRVFYYVRGWSLEGVRQGEWKLRLEGGLENRSSEYPPLLFNLEVDPSERYDRSREFPEITESLLKKLEAFGLEVSRARTDFAGGGS